MSSPPAARRPGTDGNDYMCVLTGDKLFSHVHPHELVEDGLAYCVRGSMDEGLSALALESAALPSDGELPLHVIDVVRWAGLRRVQLDKPGFVKHWQRYVGALQRHIEGSGGSTSVPESDSSAGEGAATATSQADELLLRAHTFARKLLHGFDELDFLLSASENAHGPLIVLHYKDDDPLTPYLYVLAEGVTTRPAAPLFRS